MWIIRWIGFSVLTLLILVFVFQNMSAPPLKEGLSLHFFSHQTPVFPVFFWLLFSFFTGIFFFAFISFIREIRFRTEISRLRRGLRERSDREENTNEPVKPENENQ